MKIIWHRISIQTLLFQACLPTRQNGVENRDKAYSTGIRHSNTINRGLQEIKNVWFINKVDNYRYFGHHKEIRLLTFRALALRKRE